MGKELLSIAVFGPGFIQTTILLLVVDPVGPSLLPRALLAALVLNHAVE